MRMSQPATLENTVRESTPASPQQPAQTQVRTQGQPDQVTPQLHAPASASSHYLYLIIGIPAAAFVIAALPTFQARGIPLPLNNIAAGSIGLLLQAIPFVLIGVLISGAVETWMTEGFIERHFPRTVFGGFMVALLAGLCMPVCDCVVVPTFARLVGKRLPLPYAVTFLCAVPVINPVAIWSTWFAFWDTPWMVAARIGLGCVVALIVGASFLIIPTNNPVVRSPNASADDHTRGLASHMLDLLVASPSCATPHAAMQESKPETRTRSELIVAALRKLPDYARHIHDDFMTMMPIILFGVLITSTIRALLGTDPSSKLKFTGLIGAIAIMMAIAYVSSLCSTSDAVIARSLATAFPTPSILAFLIFGPILDLKNTLMLMSQCHWKFTLRLALTITLTCFLVTVTLGYGAQWLTGGAI